MTIPYRAARLVALGVLALTLAPAPSASADPIDDLRNMVFAPGSDVMYEIQLMRERAEFEKRSAEHQAIAQAEWIENHTYDIELDYCDFHEC